jgi:excisionase family DNA binding protein
MTQVCAVPENILRAVKAMLEPFASVEESDITEMIKKKVEGPRLALGKMLTINQAAAILGVSRVTIHARINDGSLPAIPLNPTGATHCWRIPESALAEMGKRQANYISRRSRAIAKGMTSRSPGKAIDTAAALKPTTEKEC